MRTFSSILGPSVVSADGFFSLNAQPSDADLLSPAQRQVVRVSSTLCRLSERVPPLAHLADSLMVESTNAK
jgi:hypothetical protein